jgi:hypothetical protein
MALKVSELNCIRWSPFADPEEPWGRGGLAESTLISILEDRAKGIPTTQCPNCACVVHEAQLVEVAGKIRCLGGCITIEQVRRLI